MDKIHTVGNYAEGRNNNYDILRFIAALLVIFSHAYPLSANEGEFLAVISNGQWNMGAMAVSIFFVISGFLITQSFDRSSSLVKFIKSRILRIFPGLFVTVVFCAFVIGPLVTELSIKEYFTHSDTYNYLKTIFLFPMYWTLPGVFESSSFNNSVNGSLWTLPFEMMSYIVVLILGVAGLIKHRKIILLIFFLSLYIKKYLLIYIPTNLTWVYLPSFFELFPFFSAGILLYVYRDKIVLDKWYAFISLVLILISIKFGGFVDTFTIFGSYLICYIAYNQKVTFFNFTKYGDLSYGIYIYAFPIQQTVTYYFNGEISVLLNIIISTPLVILLSYLSWHLVEKPALNLRNKNIFANIKIPLTNSRMKKQV